MASWGKACYDAAVPGEDSPFSEFISAITQTLEEIEQSKEQQRLLKGGVRCLRRTDGCRCALLYQLRCGESSGTARTVNRAGQGDMWGFITALIGGGGSIIVIILDH